MKSSYRHTQIGWVSLSALLLGLAVTAWVGLETDWNPVVLWVMAFLLLGAILFASLTVEIGDGALECRFGPGLIRKPFALESIRDARPVRNRSYYGWGIRWTPGGWMFNVSGLDAVALTLASGRKFRIGTDRPAELAAAIRRTIA